VSLRHATHRCVLGHLGSDPGIEHLTRFTAILHARFEGERKKPKRGWLQVSPSRLLSLRLVLDVDVASNVPAEVEALCSVCGQRTDVTVGLKQRL
jgi:hypothetical protein